MESMLMRDLEGAAMHFNKRHYFLSRALHKYIAFNKLHAIAFIRFSPLLENGYNIIYAGVEQESFSQWIQSLMADTADKTMMNLTNTRWDIALKTGTLYSYEQGIVISWKEQQQERDEALEQLLFQGLKAISFVELKESDHFYEVGTPFEADVAQSIQAKDQDGIVELLSLTKLMTKSDITFWGEADSRQVEVDMHIGSKNSDFGFLLPVGEGIGGLAAKNNIVLQVADYQNCAYRYKDVSVAVDEEKIRTVFALPLKDNDRNTSGILYVGNRTVNPLPLEKKFLLLRLGNQLEPIVKRKEIKQFFTTAEEDTFFKRKKSELREIGQVAREFNEIESWLANLLHGEVRIVTNDEEMTKRDDDATERSGTKLFHSFPITLKERHLGELHIWTNIELPLRKKWPDLIDDVIYTIFIIHERNERYYHLAELERSQWLYNMLQSTPDLDVQYEKGVKLRAPVDSGEVWAFHLNKVADILSIDEKMGLEEVSLQCLREPIFFNGTHGFILFDRSVDCSPEQLRNKMLAVLPVETWLVHGATYNSFAELHDLLTQLQTLLETTVHQNSSEYVLTFENFGLENLLSNPRISGDLQSFAKHILQTVINYDKENDSELTKTLALSLIYKSPSKVAKKLFVHPNTVHYRVNRAKQLLNINLDDVSSEIALTFAAYTWLFEQNITIDNK